MRRPQIQLTHNMAWKLVGNLIFRESLLWIARVEHNNRDVNSIWICRLCVLYISSLSHYVAVTAGGKTRRDKKYRTKWKFVIYWLMTKSTSLETDREILFFFSRIFLLLARNYERERWDWKEFHSNLSL